jgi:transcriptional regulator GlxA family with amidase domain
MNIVSVFEKHFIIVKSENKKFTTADCERLLNIHEFVKANLDEQISLKQIAGIACMTKQSFCRFFKKKTTKKFFDYVKEVRMEHAAELLMQPSGNSICHIAYCCGYKYSSHFCKTFKNYYGQSPYKYRANNKLTA